jgi:excinuclease UvrABC ATPase subunit
MTYHICPRCNGNRIIEKYHHVEAGICFECSGSGRVIEEEYSRIEKEIVKEIKRNSTMQKNRQKKLVDSLKKQWFNNSNTIYIIDNSNTFSIKDQLKQDGAIFNYNHKVWYFTEVKSEYNLFTISWDEITDNTNYGSNLQKLINEKSQNGLKGY